MSCKLSVLLLYYLYCVICWCELFVHDSILLMLFRGEINAWGDVGGTSVCGLEGLVYF